MFNSAQFLGNSAQFLGNSAQFLGIPYLKIVINKGFSAYRFSI